jgi:shikimate kinase
MNPSPNLFLVGPMGAGKTTLGQRLAAHFSLPFHDLDHAIELRTGASVNLVFDIEGEPGFRQRETALLAEFARGTGLVLATGGGAVLDPRNRELLRGYGFVVWLDADPSVQLARLERDRRRPLLAREDRRRTLDRLALERNPVYAALADLHVPSCGNGNCQQQAASLAALLEHRWQRSDAHAVA